MFSKEIDLKTGRLPFTGFCGLIRSFQSTTIDEKIAKFFKLIDDDGNGLLSFEELVTLAKKSFHSLQSIDDDKVGNANFYDKLS